MKRKVSRAENIFDSPGSLSAKESKRFLRDWDNFRQEWNSNFEGRAERESRILQQTTNEAILYTVS